MNGNAEVLAEAGLAAERNNAAGPLPAEWASEKRVIFISHPSDLLTDHLPNGDGLVAFGFIQTLAARGHRLHIAARQAELRWQPPANVTLYPISGAGADGMSSRLRYMMAVRKLLRRLRRDEPIEIVHQMNPVFTGLSLGLLGCGLPLVLGTYVGRWPAEPRAGALVAVREALGNVSRRFLGFLQQAQASALLMTTPIAEHRITFPGLMRKKMFTVRHGVDAELFSPGDAEPGAQPAEPSVLFYSQLDRRKGVFVLIEAFRTVLDAMPECRLTLVGRGDHVDEVRRMIATLGMEHAVTLLGRVDREQAPPLFRSHSLYCLASYSEPYATTVIEAMACGRPVVLTDAGGLPYLPPPEGQALVPVGDAPALAAAMIGLLRDPERMRNMGAANHAFVREHYTWDRVVDDLENVYAVLRDRTRGPGR